MEDIFSHFIATETDTKEDRDKRIAYSFWFTESFPDSEFKGEDLIFYDIARKSAKFSIPIKERFIDVYVKTDLKKFVYESKVRVSGTETFILEDPIQLESACEVIADIIRSEYYQLKTLATELDDFIIDVKQFMETQRQAKIMELLLQSHDTMTSLSNGQMGSSDAVELINYQSEIIKEIYSEEKLEELGDYTDGIDKGVQKKKFRFAFKTGLEPIDSDTGGIFTSQLIGIEAPPGMGKTRAAIGLFMYQAAVFYGLNVVFHALEQAEEEIEAMLVALHAFHLYDQRIYPDNMIRSGELKGEDLRRVEAARMDLFESGKYGKLKIKDATKSKLYLETFINKLKMEDKLEGGYDVYIIDYMALIEQEPPKRGQYRAHLDDWKIIQRAYRKFKSFVLHNAKVGIAVNQLNAEGEKKAKAGKDITTTDAQGGMEVYRSTDYNIAMGATQEMEDQNIRRFNSPKKRSAKGLGAILVETRLAVCYFFMSKKL